MRLPWRTALPVLVSALCGAVACGGGEREPPAASAGARPVAAASAANAGDCRQLLAVRAAVQAALAGRADEADGPLDFLERYAASGPAAIRGDVRVIADAYGRLVPALREAEPAPGEAADPAALDRLQKTVSRLDQDRLATANANVSAWVAAHC